MTDARILTPIDTPSRSIFVDLEFRKADRPPPSMALVFSTPQKPSDSRFFDHAKRPSADLYRILRRPCGVAAGRAVSTVYSMATGNMIGHKIENQLANSVEFMRTKLGV
ncbi:MAG: hypothetical protein M3N35_13260 [Candidatus Binatota bacterium]|nr:hypothetical protein [Candidatus Binatota bacterium]